MVRSALRGVLCVLLGAFVGSVLGPLFVPDPTGLLAFGLAFAVTLAISTSLYRSDWLRSG